MKYCTIVFFTYYMGNMHGEQGPIHEPMSCLQVMIILFCLFPNSQLLLRRLIHLSIFEIGADSLPRRPEVFNSHSQILTLPNKVPGYWLQGKTDLANKKRFMQIFPHSKFGINRTTGLKVMAKKFKFWPRYLFCHNFWASSPIDPKFEVWKNLHVSRLFFAKSVSPCS